MVVPDEQTRGSTHSVDVWFEELPPLPVNVTLMPCPPDPCRQSPILGQRCRLKPPRENHLYQRTAIRLTPILLSAFLEVREGR